MLEEALATDSGGIINISSVDTVGSRGLLVNQELFNRLMTRVFRLAL
jgi:hypothetical protein